MTDAPKTIAERLRGEAASKAKRYWLRDADMLNEAASHIEALEAREKEMRAHVRQVLIDVGQLLDGWRQTSQPCEWTEWDQSVRSRVAELLSSTVFGGVL